MNHSNHNHSNNNIINGNNNPIDIVGSNIQNGSAARAERRVQRLRAAPGQRTLWRNRAKTNIRKRQRQQQNFMTTNNGNNGNNLNSETLVIQNRRRNEIERINMIQRQREREEFIEAKRQRNQKWVEEKLKSPQSIMSSDLGFDENGDIFGFEALDQEFERMRAKLDNMNTMKQFMMLHLSQSRGN